MFINVGAQYDADKKDIPTKAALKAQIKADPSKVYIYPTSDFAGLPGTLDIMDKGHKYSVTGPNPYNSRKWYATIEITISGAIRVS